MLEGIFRKIGGVAAAILFLVILSSGIFANVASFFTWLFVLDYSKPELSIAGDIIVRLLTFAVSYSLVGLFFGWLGWFNGKFMKAIYFIVSTVVGFVFTYFVWQIEEHIVTIIVVASIILLLIIGALVVSSVLRKRKQNKENSEEAKSE